MKLYRYCSYELFKGVDINVICKHKNELIIDSRICHDLSASKKTIESYIDTLVESGYFTWQHHNAYIETFDNDIRWRISEHDNNAEIVEVLTPLTQLNN